MIQTASEGDGSPASDSWVNFSDSPLVSAGPIISLSSLEKYLLNVIYRKSAQLTHKPVNFHRYNQKFKALPWNKNMILS